MVEIRRNDFRHASPASIPDSRRHRPGLTPSLQALLNFTKGDIFATLTGKLIQVSDLKKRSEPWREYH